MRKIIFLLFLTSCSVQSNAQNDSIENIVAFKITDYMKPLDDSTMLVQVVKPESLPLDIKLQQLGTMLHCYKTGVKLDTASIGWGRCQLIKGEYYYFSMHINTSQQPSAGDLLYVKLRMPYVYNGLLLGVMNRAMQFNNVYDEPFMTDNAVFTNTKKNELDLLDSMVSDIRFTGKEILKQMPEQNKVLNAGIYSGKKLFDAMQGAKRSELESFLKYIAARPKNYAGNDWKISEIYATWMSGGTPTVVED